MFNRATFCASCDFVASETAAADTFDFLSIGPAAVGIQVLFSLNHDREELLLRGGLTPDSSAFGQRVQRPRPVRCHFRGKKEPGKCTLGPQSLSFRIILHQVGDGTEREEILTPSQFMAAASPYFKEMFYPPSGNRKQIPTCEPQVMMIIMDE